MYDKKEFRFTSFVCIMMFIIMLILGSCENYPKLSGDFENYDKNEPMDTTIVVPADSIKVVSDSQISDILLGYHWKFLVFHCTASQSKYTKPDVFQRYWKENNGWGNTPGYTFIVNTNGDIHVLRDNNFDAYITNDEITYGVKGMNRYSVHIAYVGGVIMDNGKLVPYDTRTVAQKRSMNMLVRLARKANSNIQVVGHRDVQIHTNKACPSFDAKNYYHTSSLRDFFAVDSASIKILNRVKQVNK